MTQNHAGNRVGSIPTGGTKIPLAIVRGIFCIFFLAIFISTLLINNPFSPQNSKGDLRGGFSICIFVSLYIYSKRIITALRLSIADKPAVYVISFDTSCACLPIQSDIPHI